jgi:S1-C subfamily serine protease
VITAHHVVSGGLSVQKKRMLGFSKDDQLEVTAYVNGCEATVLREDPEADLTLLRVCGSRKQAGVPAFQAAPQQDERLVVIARPNGERSVKRGVFSGTYTYRGRQYWAAKIEGRDGFSGSPVYNDRGEIVGVFSGYDSTLKVALISPGARAQKLLEDYASSLKQ